MTARGPLARLMEVHERAVERVVEREQARMDALYEATAGPASGDVTRKRDESDELLKRGDPAVIARARAFGPFLSPAERAAVNRRSVKAGGAPIFKD